MTDNKIPPDVGYKKPPISGQFQKGKSGNPKGRPLKKLSLPDAFFKELNQDITVSEAGKTKRITKAEAYFKSIIAKAVAKGDPKLLDFIFKHRAIFGISEREATIPPVTVNVSFAPPPQKNRQGEGLTLEHEKSIDKDE